MAGPAGQLIVGGSTMMVPPFVSQGNEDGLAPGRTFTGSWEEVLEQKPAGSNLVGEGEREKGGNRILWLSITCVSGWHSLGVHCQPVACFPY